MTQREFRAFSCVVMFVIVFFVFSSINVDILTPINSWKFKRSNMLGRERSLFINISVNSTFQGKEANKTDEYAHLDHKSRIKNEKLVSFSATELNATALKPTAEDKETTNLQSGEGRDAVFWSKTSIEKADNITLHPETADGLRASQPVYIANYVMENEKLCSSVADLLAVVIVHTNPRNFEFRDIIRETWANNSYYSDLGTVKILFLLGLVNDSKIQDLLEREFSQHRDLLQGDFMDDYHNLTLKGVMAYKWLTEKCRNAQIVVKSDDDVVVNMMSVLTSINLFKARQISCLILTKAKVYRSPTFKWSTENKYFSNLKTFPAYCKGPFVVFSNDLIPGLYKSSLLTPFFWIDDIYLYGLVPLNVKGVTLKYCPGIVWSEVCISRQSCPFTAVMFRSRNSQMMYSIWNLMLNSYKPDASLK